ncbi:MAG TPA: DUF2252 family protein [Vicinamibacterales bacterium]|nr:DUF2252 family protein [Vicinamibacterales bacterium]
MDIRSSTNRYEKWLASRTAVVRSDLNLKHERMRASPFVFLRATYYRWASEYPRICRKAHDAPVVLSVGDLHVENYGTWRDREGRLVWGVNDVDEARQLPYTNDLIRLATSAALAELDAHLSMPLGDACETILEGYVASLERGGRPIVLAERRRWLRDAATGELRDPVRFWERLTALPTLRMSGGRPPSYVPRQLFASLPDGAVDIRVARRIAGAGSLGRPRFVALATVGGGLVAREAKAFLGSVSSARQLIECTTRASDPFLTIAGGWVVRRLAPDCSRIELAELPRRRDEQRLLRAMGWEAANIHASRGGARIRRDLRGRRPRWLERAASEMVDATISDWKAWKKLSG